MARSHKGVPTPQPGQETRHTGSCPLGRGCHWMVWWGLLEWPPQGGDQDTELGKGGAEWGSSEGLQRVLAG